MATVVTDQYAINKQYLPTPSKRRSGLLIQQVKFLVAHDTGNPGSTASANVRYYTSTCNEQSASAHLFVDDREIIECIPAFVRPEKAWHVLYNVPKDNELYGANANDAAIGVEYCYGKGIDATEAYNRYVWVMAKLCLQYHLNPARHIVGHFFLDPKRKTDPVTGLANSRRTYEGLLRDVALECIELKGEDTLLPTLVVEEEVNTALVAVKLNIRQEASSRSGIIKTLRPAEKIQYDAVIRNGEPINSNPVWYHLTEGGYVWAGGLLL